MNYKELMYARFACKNYKAKRVSKEILEYILDCGRLSPSSFGLEAWFFEVVNSEKAKKDLYNACFQQESMKTSDFNIVICCPRAGMETDSPFVHQRGKRFPGTIEEFVDDFRGYRQYLGENNLLEAWQRAQTYIACTNMMNAACEKGVLSCAIEGFNEKEVLKVLGKNIKDYQVGIVCAFGYPNEEVRPKIRMELDSLVNYH